MNKAIVFNCNFNGLSIIQDLGRRGVECLALDSVRSIGTYSRYARYLRCPDPATNESGFIGFLLELCAREPLKPVLIPTNDQWAMALSRHKQRLAEVSLPCVGDWEAVRQVIDKDHFYEIGRQRGYRTPPTFRLEELAELPQTAFPLAAKPTHRRVSADARDDGYHLAMDRLRLTVLEDRAALDAFLRAEQRWLPELVFQRYVPGLSDQMYTVGIYADAGNRVVSHFTGRKVRGYPADIGDCVVGENCALPGELLDDTRRIVRDLRFSGIAEFEYKRDPGTGDFSLIEVNPRSWSWIGVTSAVGADLPWTAYRDLTGAGAAPAPGKPLPDGAVRYAKVLDDAINSLFRYRLEHPAWSRGPRAWWRDLHQGRRVVYAEFQRDEPRVALMASLRALKTLLAWLAGRARGSAS